jgi:NAD(P)-dependent dehydrogenase (short-subunit alcohol dehydrogenase family)
MDPASLSLDDRVAIVTGGSRGIGREIAETFAAAGGSVVATARSEAALGETVAAIERAGATAIGVPCDVTDEGSVAALYDEVLDSFGRVDVLVNCAGANPRSAMGRPEEVPPDAFDTPLEVNLRGAYTCVQVGADALKTDGGAVVNVASISGLVGLPRQHPYVASKHGLIGLTRSLALDWAPAVRVNALAPGYVKTAFTEDLREREELAASVLDRTPLERFAEPEEVARPALFLASEAAAYVTGAVLSVDGGWTAR